MMLSLLDAHPPLPLLCVPCCFFQQLRSYKYLAPTSFLGIFALTASVVVTLVDGFSHHTIQPIHTYATFNWNTYSLFLGNAAFLYLIHSVILPTEQSMKHRHKYGISLR